MGKAILNKNILKTKMFENDLFEVNVLNSHAKKKLIKAHRSSFCLICMERRGLENKVNKLLCRKCLKNSLYNSRYWQVN